MIRRKSSGVRVNRLILVYVLLTLLLVAVVVEQHGLASPQQPTPKPGTLLIITFENGTSKTFRVDSTNILPVTGGYLIVDPSVVPGQPLPTTTISNKVVNQINTAIAIAITIIQQQPPPPLGNNDTLPPPPSPSPPPGNNDTLPPLPPGPPICPEGLACANPVNPSPPVAPAPPVEEPQPQPEPQPSPEEPAPQPEPEPEPEPEEPDGDGTQDRSDNEGGEEETN